MDVLVVEERKGFLVGYEVYIKFRFVVVGLFAVDRVVGDGGHFLCVRCVKVAGQVWAVLPVRKYEDMAAGGGVSVCVCDIDCLFQCLLHSVWCVFR